MGASAAVGILHRKKLAAAPPGEREALHAQLAEEHERIAGGVARAMEIGVVDELHRAAADPGGAGRPRSPRPPPAAARTATSRSRRAPQVPQKVRYLPKSCGAGAA